MRLFCVEDKKAYQRNTADFRKMVLDVAIDEINQYTELEVRYEVEKKGRRVVGFELVWSTGDIVKSATKKQIKELKSIVDTIMNDSLDLLDVIKIEHQHEAIQLIKAIRDMVPMTKEPISITYDRADLLIKQANWNIKELHRLANKKDSLYYNWLED